MLLELIATLGLTVIFSENPKIECMSDNEINGCYIPWNKTIVISYNSWNPNHTLHHEIGHALFPGCSEELADQYAEYKINNKQFSVTNPSLYIYFRDREQEIYETN